jgi:hypothetical protein
MSAIGSKADIPLQGGKRLSQRSNRAGDAPLLQNQLVLVLTVALVSPFELRAVSLTVLALAVL